MAEALKGSEVIGLDTETVWQRGGRESSQEVSLIQIARPAGEVFVVDALAIGADAARGIVESDEIIKAAHNARFDEGVLIGAGLRPRAFVDTLQLARWALDAPSYSLKTIVGQLFEIELDKSFQKSNWQRRPLTAAQINYAALDAYVTLKLYFELERMLRAQGRWETALRAATLRPRDANAPPAARRRSAPRPAPAPLTADEQATVRRLKQWRLTRSRELRVPAYMICQDRTLEHLAQARPETREALNRIHGLGAAKIERFGDELIKALCGTAVTGGESGDG